MIAPTFHSQRLTLRGLAERDFPRLAEFYQSPRADFVGGPLRPDQTWRMLATEIGHWTLRGYGRFAVEETASGEFVGIVGPWNPEGWPEPELGWDLMNGFEGKGYATEAAIASRNFAYDTLGWTTAISLVADGNDASAGVALRAGATEDGRFSHVQFGDMTIYRHPGPAA